VKRSLRAAAYAWLVAALTGVCLLPSVVHAADEPKLVVTLLGTGDPIPSATRNGPAILVQAGDLKVMIDAGRGNTVRLRQVGLWPGQIDAVFITHFHSDHLNGLADLLTLGYIGRPDVRRRQPLQIVGPIGMKRIAEALRASVDDDVKIRTADEKITPAGAEMDVREFSGDGVVFERDGLKVTAFAVDHGVFIKPAYGYRIDYRGLSALFSGDTRFDENLIANAAGLDLLVHETAVAPVALQNLDTVKAVLAHHTTPEQAGDVFARARPKVAAFSHITLIADAAHPAVTEVEIERRAHTKWDGLLVVGEGLMRVTVSPSSVTFDRLMRK